MSLKAILLKLRRGTKAEHEAFIGSEGETTYITDEKRLTVHDGVTPGGTELAKKSEIAEFLEVANDMSDAINNLNKLKGIYDSVAIQNHITPFGVSSVNCKNFDTRNMTKDEQAICLISCFSSGVVGVVISFDNLVYGNGKEAKIRFDVYRDGNIVQSSTSVLTDANHGVTGANCNVEIGDVIAVYDISSYRVETETIGGYVIPTIVREAWYTIGVIEVKSIKLIIFPFVYFVDGSPYEVKEIKNNITNITQAINTTIKARLSGTTLYLRNDGVAP
jgi:hypothetical protein